jgi:hypothetical protein
MGFSNFLLEGSLRDRRRCSMLPPYLRHYLRTTDYFGRGKMPLSSGYDQLQPKYILGTDEWVGSVAESLVGAEFNPPNQLREHFPFFPFARSRSVVVPRVQALCTAGFIGTSTGVPDASVTQLSDPAEEIEMTSLSGDVTLTNFPIDIESYNIDQLQLQIEFKKIAIHVLFWDQFFRPRQPGGFRGLPDLVAPAQVIPAGGALTLEAMDLLVARVTESNAEMTRRVIVMNSATFIQYVRARRAHGLGLEYAMRAQRRYAVHNGVVILVSDFIPSDRSLKETAGNLASVWCFALGYEDKGVFGVVPPDVGEDGLVVERVQGSVESDTVTYRVRWYTAVVLGHPRALACLDQVRLG